MRRVVLLAALLLVTRAVVLAQVTLKSGEAVNTQTASAIDTSTLKTGDTLTLNVVQPYPSGAQGLSGAKITLSVTSVTHVQPRNRARVGFLFNQIIFSNGKTEQIAAFVLSSKVVRRGDNTSQNMGLTTPVNPVGPTPLSAQSNTIFWHHTLGKGTTAPTMTGGFAYTASGDVKLPAGTPVTIQLARDLTIPE